MVRSQTVSLIGEEPPPPTKKPTAITISVNPTQGVIPYRALVGGMLFDAETWIGIPLVQVAVYFDGVLVARVTTAQDGGYTSAVDVKTAGTHTVYTEFAGNDVYEGCRFAEPLEQAFQSVLRRW